MEHKFEQGSDEWFLIRSGKITGSMFPIIMKTGRGGKGYSESMLTYLREVSCEILTGKTKDNFSARSTDWGNDHEGEAIEALSDYLMKPIRSCGFFEHSKFIGASPDGIIGDMEMTAEIKCPYNSDNHLLYYLDSNELWKKYKWQVIGEALCTGIHKGIIASYDPRFPADKQLVVHDPGDISEDIEKLKNRIVEAVILIKDMIK